MAQLRQRLGAAMRVLSLTLLAAAGCASQPPDAGGADNGGAPRDEFRGIYVSGFENVSFRPCGSSERWWVVQSGPLREPYRDLVTRQYEPVFAVVRGDTTALGRYGHMSAFDRELRVSDVVSVSVLEPGDRSGARACETRPAGAP